MPGGGSGRVHKFTIASFDLLDDVTSLANCVRRMRVMTIPCGQLMVRLGIERADKNLFKMKIEK